MDWTTWKSNHFNQRMYYECSSLDLISGMAMIVGLKIIHTSSEHYTTGIYSNLYRSVWHISQLKRTSISNRCGLQTRKVAKPTVRSTQVIGGGMRKISYLLERRLCHSFGHLTRPLGLIFRVTSMPHRCISRSIIFEKISAGHLISMLGFLFGWSPVPW
jgi:hypothetical protein